MKTFTKSVLMFVAVASFVTFAACGNSGAEKAKADSIAAAAMADSIAKVQADSIAACEAAVAAAKADSIAAAQADSIAKATKKGKK